jgi:ureidoglycolate lyase
VRRRVELRASISVTTTEIEATAFAPFGDVVRALRTDGRTEWSDALKNTRANARISLYTSAARAVRLPVELSVMERHPHSFQTFIPLDTSRYLICVAPNGAGDLPVLESLRAFIVGAGTGITYRANIWHHPMMALDRLAQFAVWMWRSGGDDDEEFVDLVPPARVQGP